MARSTSKVDKTAFGEENNVAAAVHEVTVNLGLDVLDGLGVLLQPGDVDFDVEMSNIWV